MPAADLMIPKPDWPDEDLIDRARGGDEPAFELLMRRHSAAVRNLIAHYFRDRSVVDELAQETFVKAWFGLRTFRGAAPVVIWLKRIAVRLCLDEMRRRASRPIAWGQDEPAAAARDDSGTSRSDARLLLDKVLKPLAPMDRMILLLLYGEGYDVKEVSHLTGLSQPNVKVRAFRIRRRLRMLSGEI
jgi:RNA polymerase sigma-70 factor, ECF subfamily